MHTSHTLEVAGRRQRDSSIDAHPVISTAPPLPDRGEINKIAYTIEEAVRASGLGRTTIYSLLNRGSLRKIKVGTRTLIFREDLVSLLEAAATEDGSAH